MIPVKALGGHYQTKINALGVNSVLQAENQRQSFCFPLASKSDPYSEGAM